MRSVSKTNIVFALFLMLTVASLTLTGTDFKYNAANLVVSLFSVVIIFFAIESTRVVGIKAYNIFLIAFYFPLFLNSLIMSDRQIEKQFLDIYFLFFGPLLFVFILYFFEKASISRIKSRYALINVESLYLLALVVFVLLKLYIGSVKGFKISAISLEGADLSFNAFALPGFSGVAGILQWVILILSFCVRRKYRWAGILCLVVFNSILGVNRGDFTRTVTFILLYQIFELNYNKGVFREIFARYKQKLLRAIGLFLLIFVLFGQLREIFQVREVSLITELLGSKVDSLIFAWLYSYFSLGYDVLLLYVRAEYFGHTEYLTAFLNPSEKLSPPVSLTIWPFNQTTVLRNYIAAFGYHYYIGFALKAVCIGVILLLAKALRIKGLYVFVIMFLIFSFFSEYFLSRSILAAMALVILVYPFLKFSKNCDTHENRH